MKTYNVVSAFVRNPAGDVLLIYQLKPGRADSCFHGDNKEDFFWTIPGGKIDPGESQEQALVREIKEETGLDVLAPFVPVSRCRYISLEEHYICDVQTYEIINWQGDICIDDPCQRVKNARFYSLTDAIQKSSEIPWACMREPFHAFLTGDHANNNWFYRAYTEGRMDVITEMDFLNLVEVHNQSV